MSTLAHRLGAPERDHRYVSPFGFQALLQKTNFSHLGELKPAPYVASATRCTSLLTRKRTNGTSA